MRTSDNVRIAVAVLTVLCAGTSCGAFEPGNNATDQEGTSENAANATIGSIRIDDAYVQLGSGPNLRLHVTLANTGTVGDRLQTITVKAKTSGTVEGDLPLELAPGADVALDNGDGGYGLKGVAPRPKAGDDLTVSFTFATAGTSTLDLPVVGTTP